MTTLARFTATIPARVSPSTIRARGVAGHRARARQQHGSAGATSCGHGVNTYPRWCPTAVVEGRLRICPLTYLGAHQLTCSDNAPSAPTGRTTAAWWLDPRGFDSAARQQPRGDRVRVPKLAGVKFIAAPHRRWHRWHQIEESLGAGEIDVHGHGGGGFAYVGDDAFPPASDLVTEQPKSARPFGSHGAFGHDASPLSVKIGDGCHLNHEAAFGDDDFERRVVEVARPAPLDERRYGLEHLAARPDDGLACPERDPVESHGRDRHTQAASGVTLEEIAVHPCISARRIADVSDGMKVEVVQLVSGRAAHQTGDGVVRGCRAGQHGGDRFADR